MGAFTFKLFDKTPPISVAQYRDLARKRLPKVVWAYLDGGADDLVTLARNEAGFRRWRLRQRVLSGVSNPILGTTMIDANVSLPVALAPTGCDGLFHWGGEAAAIAAAEQAGTRGVLSTASSYTMEEVAAATEQKHWFQLYPIGDRDIVGGLLDRAAAAGYSALFVTVDTAVLGNRESERMNGMETPLQLNPKRCLNLARYPRWLYGVARYGRIAPVHYLSAGLYTKPQRGIRKAARQLSELAAKQARFMQSDLNWEDMAWIRDRWTGPLYIKGVLDADDAERIVDRIGVNGVIVSNHGGRQLDRSLATIDALPAIAARIGNRAEIYLDGGIRRGTDVITALCLGAKGVFIGRPYLYGLAVDGRAGVQRVLEIFKEEMNRDLILMGCPDIALLDRTWLSGEDQP